MALVVLYLAALAVGIAWPYRSTLQVAVAFLIAGLVACALVSRWSGHWPGLAAGAVFWIQHTRGLKWVDRRDPGTQYRLLMWKDGARLATQHPLFGVGMDSAQNRWPEWHLEGFAKFQQFWNFHSDLVQLAAERGFLTLAAWLWFVVDWVMIIRNGWTCGVIT